MTALADRIASEQSDAWRALTDGADGLGNQDVPCRRDLAAADAWTSDDPHESAVAARACRPCPLLAACRSYALEHHEPVGVWGGLTVTERRQVRKGRAA